MIPVLLWSVAAVLSAAAWAWSGRVQRAEADRGLQERTNSAAGFTREYLYNIMTLQHRDAMRFLSTPTITAPQLEEFSAGFGYSVMVALDSTGHVMASWPRVPALIGRDLEAILPHLRPAVRQHRLVVSNVYLSPFIHRPLVALIVPFPTPHGYRTFYGGFAVEQSRLGIFLRYATTSAKGQGYYVDRQGAVVAATVPVSGQITPLSRLNLGLARALSRRPAGSYPRGGHTWRYASAPVVGTTWKLVTEVAESRLYAQADRTQRRYGELLVVAAVLAVGVVLAAATYRTPVEQRLRRLNQQYAEQATALRIANRELEAFSSSVAHDLRSPLRSLISFSEIVLDDYADQTPDEAIRLINKIWAAGERMNGIIEALLSLSRLSRQPMRIQIVNLADLTRQVWDDLAERRRDRDIRFDMADLPPCQGDPRLLEQVLANLLDNAIKFTRDQPAARIQVDARPGPGGFTTYEVKDNGAGFDSAYADHLFKPFGRLHRTSEYPGSGVGLSLVKRIINRHGGTISAKSTLGQETTITFTLPNP